MPKIHARECAHCGGKFQTRWGKQIYCGVVCRRRSWRSANIEKARRVTRVSQANYRLRNVAKCREASDLWVQANPERAKEIRRASKARRRDRIAAGSVTTCDLKAIAAQAESRCAYCGVKVEHLVFKPSQPNGFDHVVPLSRGGRHEPSNLVVCCGSCNQVKGARTPSEWIAAHNATAGEVAGG